MTMLRLFCTTFLAGLILPFSAAHSQNEAWQDSTEIAKQYKPVKAQPHSDFILPSVDDGSSVQLSSLRGNKVLLLHFASW